MHTFDVYRLYCCLLCLWFLVCLPWIGSRGRNQIKTKCSNITPCVQICIWPGCNIWNVYFSESFRCGGKALVLLLPPPPPGCLLGNGDRGATAQNKRRVIFNTASATNFHSLLFRFVLSFAGLVVGFDLFALLLFRTEFVFDIVCWCFDRGKLEYVSLVCVCVHNLEPKRRAALRFPSFWVQNFALFQPNDNFPSSIFLILNRFSPPTESCFAYLRMLRLVVSELLFFAASK